MQYAGLKGAVLALLTANAAAKTIRIDVGQGGHRFSPDTVTAGKGDVLEYHFTGSKHSVAASDLSKACSPRGQDGFYSGVVQAKGDDPSVFTVTVNSTDPLFFYCSVGHHCQDGMIGVVNPTSDQSLDKYRSAAKSAGDNVSPNAVYGGKLIKPGEGSSSDAKPSNAAENMRASLALAGAAVGAAALLV